MRTSFWCAPNEVLSLTRRCVPHRFGERPGDEKLLSDCVSVQRRLFWEAVSTVKKGGCVVFATCSVLWEEGEGQVLGFLREGGGGRVAVDEVRGEEVPGFEEDVKEGGWVRVWPGEKGDGFFVCRFRVL